MKKQVLNVELCGPCSVTGAVPNLGDTVATIDNNGRVGFHRVMGIEKGNDREFAVIFKNNDRCLAANCFLLYTTELE